MCNTNKTLLISTSHNRFCLVNDNAVKSEKTGFAGIEEAQAEKLQHARACLKIPPALSHICMRMIEGMMFIF